MIAPRRRRRRLVLVDAGDQLVEVAEELVGRQVQGGEVVHRGAQPAHGGRGVQAVADDVADDQRDPGAGQRDDVEPVAAHPGLRGQVAVGDVEGVLLGQAARQQAALEGHGHGVLAGVAAGVVDGHRGPGGQFLGEGQVVLLEGLGLLRAPEAGHAQDARRGPAAARRSASGCRTRGPARSARGSCACQPGDVGQIGAPGPPARCSRPAGLRRGRARSAISSPDAGRAGASSRMPLTRGAAHVARRAAGAAPRRAARARPGRR